MTNSQKNQGLWVNIRSFDFLCFFGYTGVAKITFMTINNIIRLSISEAARMFGVSQRTIRRAISAGEITYVVVQGRYKINFESLLIWSQKTTTVKNKMAKNGIGQYVGQWKIKNKLYSPNPKSLSETEDK
jgi:excisionase family DNA binding protein